MEQMTFQRLSDELVTLYTTGKFADALDLVEQHANGFPQESARTTFWRLCLLSLCGRTGDVLSVFRQGLDSGLWWAESQFIDTDLDAVRDLPEFQQLMAESNSKAIEMQSHIEPARTVLLPETASGKLPLLISLHGRNGSKDSNLQFWAAARQRGWLVLSPQSRQALFPGSYCWDDAEKGLVDILFHVEEIKKQYSIDPERIVLAGFSQGSGMSIYAALSEKMGARGFIGVGTFILEPEVLVPLISQSKPIRGYFVTGEKDNTLDKAKAIQKILQEHNIPFAEKMYPDLGHEFPPDFDQTFEQAIEFIFKEQE
jgi:predicted esterase